MVLNFFMTVSPGVSTYSWYTSAIQYQEIFTGKFASDYLKSNIKFFLQFKIENIFQNSWTAMKENT